MTRVIIAGGLLLHELLEICWVTLQVALVLISLLVLRILESLWKFYTNKLIFAFCFSVKSVESVLSGDLSFYLRIRFNTFIHRSSTVNHSVCAADVLNESKTLDERDSALIDREQFISRLGVHETCVRWKVVNVVPSKGMLPGGLMHEEQPAPPVSAVSNNVDDIRGEER